MSYNMNTGAITEIAPPAYTGVNASLAFSISGNGSYIAGTSGNSTQPYIWSATSGMNVVPLPAGTSTAGLRSVNDAGWAVGTAGGRYAAPFLYANGTTYTLANQITNLGDWNFTTTTSAASMGIDDNGDITGWAMLDGTAHAYLLTPVPEPSSYALMLGGLLVVGGGARRRRRA